MKTSILTISTQADLEREIAGFRTSPADLRWLRIDPMVGPIILGSLLEHDGKRHGYYAGCYLDRVTVAGGSEPLKASDVRSVRDQCLAAGIDFIFESWGEWAPWSECGYDPWTNKYPCVWPEGNVALCRVGSSRSGRMLDGRIWEGATS